jgi:hypothetical protein
MLLEVFCPNSDIEHQRCDLNLECRINKTTKEENQHSKFSPAQPSPESSVATARLA